MPPCGAAGCSNLTSVDGCKALAKAIPGCAGFTWEAAGKLCWLKRGPFNVQPPFRSQTGRESQAFARIGASVPLLNSGSGHCSQPMTPDSGLVQNADLGGVDMSPCKELPGTGCPGIPGHNDTAEACAALCRKTAGCAGYVWNQGNGSCGSPTCWIKQGPLAADPFVRNRTCRSAEVFSRPSACKPLLNGNRTFLVGTLDQSWWPDGEFTAPSDAALESDLIATKRSKTDMLSRFAHTRVANPKASPFQLASMQSGCTRR